MPAVPGNRGTPLSPTIGNAPKPVTGTAPKFIGPKPVTGTAPKSIGTKPVTSTAPKSTAEQDTDYPEPTSLFGSIEALRAFTPRLNAVTDKANRAVEGVEVFLNEECSIGIPTHVLVESTEDGGVSLEYRRVGPRFRIAVVIFHDEHENVKAWSDCDRETKLATFQKLTSLLLEIAKAVEGKLAETEKTVSVIDGILDALKGKEASGPA